ncbi:MAG: hypothetical protein FWC41_02395 [Firmicutes bacterium]|nr:hypothetical protein [Bacillota bacterium]
MKNNKLSIVALLVSLIAMSFTFFRITPFEFSNDIYIGIIATFVAVSATLVIGFQIVNTLEIRKEISEQRKMSDELKQMNNGLNKTIENQQNKMEEGFSIINALMQYQKGYQYSNIAFYYLHHALISSLRIDESEYEWLFEWLRAFIADINWENFNCGGISKQNDSYICVGLNSPHFQKEFKDIVKEYTIQIDEDEEKIRGDKNFCRIQMEYDRIMKLYRKRILEIIEDPTKQLTPEEKFSITHPQ